MKDISIIKGGEASDQRGQIRFVNDFDMSAVKRFYIITNADTELVRGWRGHRIEQRWFYVLSGAFEVSLLKIDNWGNASKDLPVHMKILRACNMQVLHVPKGYATAFRAIEANSELLVYADHPISHAPLDDHTWPIDYFIHYK